MNNSVSGWGEMNPNQPNSCTCYLPPQISVQYHCTNGMWTKENVSFKRNCPYHSAGGGGGGSRGGSGGGGGGGSGGGGRGAGGLDSSLFQLGYSDPISTGLQYIVNQAKIQEDEEIIQGLKDEAEKNNKNKMKMKAPTKMNLRTSVYHDQFETRKRDKIDGKIAKLEKLITSDNQTSKEYDGVIDHLKILQAKMIGINIPTADQIHHHLVNNPPPTIPLDLFLFCQTWPMDEEKLLELVDYYLKM